MLVQGARGELTDRVLQGWIGREGLLGDLEARQILKSGLQKAVLKLDNVAVNCAMRK